MRFSHSENKFRTPNGNRTGDVLDAGWNSLPLSYGRNVVDSEVTRAVGLHTVLVGLYAKGPASRRSSKIMGAIINRKN